LGNCQPLGRRPAVVAATSSTGSRSTRLSGTRPFRSAIRQGSTCARDGAATWLSPLPGTRADASTAGSIPRRRSHRFPASGSTGYSSLRESRRPRRRLGTRQLTTAWSHCGASWREFVRRPREDGTTRLIGARSSSPSLWLAARSRLTMFLSAPAPARLRTGSPTRRRWPRSRARSGRGSATRESERRDEREFSLARAVVYQPRWLAGSCFYCGYSLAGRARGPCARVRGAAQRAERVLLRSVEAEASATGALPAQLARSSDRSPLAGLAVRVAGGLSPVGDTPGHPPWPGGRGF
jgi:hypothetical protein